MTEAEQLTREIVTALTPIIGEYRRFNPDGEYLRITYAKGMLLINNEYWGADRKKPVQYCEKFNSEVF